MTTRTLALAVLALLLLLAPAAACTPSADQKPTIPPAALAALLEAGDAPFVLDVRTPEEYASGHVPGAVNVPHTELAARLDEVRADGGRPETVVVYCERGGRAAIAEDLLREAGFEHVVHLEGDMSAWRAGEFPTSR